jgi:hypothetical protein
MDNHDILDTKIGELANLIMERGMGTIHSLLQFPNDEYESIHVSVTYGNKEASAIMQAVEECIDASGPVKERMVKYGWSDKSSGEQGETDWIRPSEN